MDARMGSWAKQAGVGVLLCIAITSFANGYAGASERVRVLSAIAIAWSVALWSALDARTHHKRYVQAFWLFTIVTWPIAPLVHFTWTRGKAGPFHYLAWLALAVVIAVLFVFLGTMLRPATSSK
jgi:hypothetical protein